jgi:hypothetical protein
MFQSMKDERVKLQTALRLATAALGFYADPDSYDLMRFKPHVKPPAMIDNGKLARITLGDLTEFLDDDAQHNLRRCQLMVGEE